MKNITLQGNRQTISIMEKNINKFAEVKY